MTDTQIDVLLIALDGIARAQPYPAMGLPIWGSDDNRPALRDAVRRWHHANTPEAMR